MNSSRKSGENGNISRPDPTIPEADAKLRRMLMFVGAEVNIRTSWNSDFRGLFAGFDNHMNVILKDAKEFRRWPFDRIRVSLNFIQRF